MQHRTKVELRFEADGEEKPGPIETFRLIRNVWHQQRRNERESWLTNGADPANKSEEIADGITRNQLVALITDAAEWLSYIEEG